MNPFEYFVRLGKWAFSGITLRWEITLSLLLLCIAFTVLSVWDGGAEEKRKVKWLPLLYLYPVVHLLLGVIFRKHGAEWPGYLNYAVFFSILPVGIFAVYRLKGIRITAASHVLMTLWLSFSAGIAAGVSIANEWL
jgi:hypothetical protein